MVMRGRAGEEVVLDMWETEEPAPESLMCRSDQLQVLDVLEETPPWPRRNVELVTAEMRAAQAPNQA